MSLVLLSESFLQTRVLRREEEIGRKTTEGNSGPRCKSIGAFPDLSRDIETICDSSPISRAQSMGVPMQSTLHAEHTCEADKAANMSTSRA